jgi:hypothetical protein
MMDMDHRAWMFFTGCAPFRDFAFFARERDDLSDQDVVATSFYCWDEQSADPAERWVIYSHVVDWRAQAMASAKEDSGQRVVVCVGRQGQYYELVPEIPAQFEGSIEQNEFFPRAVASLDGVIFLTGLGRVVKRRADRGQWVDFGPSSQAEAQQEVVGFETIGGLSTDLVYVAGWHGEIWRWNGFIWQQIDVPTNANFNALACAADGTVYVVGDNGAFVQGQHDQWHVRDSAITENILSIGVYDGTVFAVTDYKILRLTDAGFVDEDRFENNDAPASCLQLLGAPDGILSMGPYDLFSFYNGLWRRII